LTPSVPHVISAAPVSNLTIKPRSVGNLGMPSTFSTFGYQQTIPQNPYMSMNQPMQNPYVRPQPMVAKSVSDQPASIAPKRDSSGNIMNKAVAAGPSSSGHAAQSLEPDAKKFKDGKGPKKKKFIRAAGGQVWEDETLAEWNPGKLLFQLYFLGFDVTTKYLVLQTIFVCFVVILVTK